MHTRTPYMPPRFADKLTSLCVRQKSDLPTFAVMLHPKHEIIYCDRCNATFECKANSFTKCQCSTVQLTLNEVQYVSELYEGCLCAKCLLELQQEYREENGVSQ